MARADEKTMFRSMLRGIVHFLLPPLCLACDSPVEGDDALCADCWKKMTFIAPPVCARCGMPFDVPVEAGTLCGACLAKAPAFAMARSALVYDEASRGLILRFKHADRVHVARGLAAWMRRAGADLPWDKIDVIVPVPLHRWRLLARRYNQAALLAQFLGRFGGCSVDFLSLVRVRATLSQGHMNRRRRAANLRRAFAVRGACLQGKTVLLVDDVMTTGATVDEAAKTLVKAGVAAVYVLTLARVKKAD